VAENVFNLIMKIIQMGVISTVLLLLINRYKRHGIQVFYIVLVFLFGLLQGVFEIVVYFFKYVVFAKDPVTQNFIYNRFNEIHTIPYSLAILTLFLFTEYMIDERSNWLRLSIVLILWSSFATLLVYDMIFSFETVTHASRMFNHVFNFFQIVTMFFILRVFYKAYKMTKNQQNKRLSLLMFIALLIFEVVAISEIFQDLFGWFQIYNAIPYSISFIILAYIYVRYPYYIFNIPINIYRISLAAKNGLLLYSAEITDGKTINDCLLAPIISAIRTAITETTGRPGELKTVTFSNRAVQVSSENLLLCYIITDHPSRILKHALDYFLEQFNRKFHFVLDFDKKPFVEPAKFQDTDSLIFRCFPFLESKEVVKAMLMSRKRDSFKNDSSKTHE